MKKCTPLWREAHLQVKKQKAPHVRSTFESCDVEKVHAIVARSTFRSQNAQSTPCTDHFWTFRSRFAWQAQGIVHLVKCEQDVRVFVAFLKTMAGVGHLKRICKDAFFRGRRSNANTGFITPPQKVRWDLVEHPLIISTSEP